MNMLFFTVTYIKSESSSHGRKASSWSDPHQAPPSIKGVKTPKKTARRAYAAIYRYNLNTFLKRLYLTEFVSLSLGFYDMMRSPAKPGYTV